MNRLKVCLDYGHGGKDLGAIYENRKESNDNLRLGKAVAEVLRNKGVFVGETRTSDEYVALNRRVQVFKEDEYDLFLSFHRNITKSEEVKGLEIYISSLASESIKKLAKGIGESLLELGFQYRGIKIEELYIFKEIKNESILLELGFINSFVDNKIFDERLEEIVERISYEIIKKAY